MKQNLRVKPSRSRFLYVGIGVLAIGVLTGVGLSIKNNSYMQHSADEKKAVQAVNSLQSRLNTLQAAVSTNNDLKDGTSGLVAMPMSLMDISGKAYTAEETATWQKCYTALDKFTKSLPKLREDAAKLDGNDAALYNTWLSNAEKLSEWGVCYKDFLYVNTDNASNADENMKNYSDRINGRINILKTQLNEANSNLAQVKSSKYFLWW